MRDTGEIITYYPSHVDVRELYGALLDRYDAFPEVLVVDGLHGDDKIECHLMSNGGYIYYLRNEKDKIETLLDQMENPSCRVLPENSGYAHRKSGRDYARWICVAYEICRVMVIGCPQILYTQTSRKRVFEGEPVLWIPKNLTDTMTLYHIIYTIRTL